MYMALVYAESTFYLPPPTLWVSGSRIFVVYTHKRMPILDPFALANILVFISDFSLFRSPRNKLTAGRPNAADVARAVVVKGKGKGSSLDKRHLQCWTAALYNLGSGS